MEVLLLGLERSQKVGLVKLLIQKLMLKHTEEEVELEVSEVPWLGLEIHSEQTRREREMMGGPGEEGRVSSVLVMKL